LRSGERGTSGWQGQGLTRRPLDPPPRLPEVLRSWTNP